MTQKPTTAPFVRDSKLFPLLLLLLLLLRLRYSGVLEIGSRHLIYFCDTAGLVSFCTATSGGTMIVRGRGGMSPNSYVTLRGKYYFYLLRNPDLFLN